MRSPCRVEIGRCASPSIPDWRRYTAAGRSSGSSTAGSIRWACKWARCTASCTVSDLYPTELRSTLRLELDDFPAKLGDFRLSHRSDHAGGREDRRRTGFDAMNLGGGRGERPLLQLGPDNVVERKRCHDIAVAGDVDGLTGDHHERSNSAEFVAARGQSLRAPPKVESNIARTGASSLFDEDGGVLRPELLERARHDEQISRREIAVF